MFMKCNFQKVKRAHENVLVRIILPPGNGLAVSGLYRKIHILTKVASVSSDFLHEVIDEWPFNLQVEIIPPKTLHRQKFPIFFIAVSNPLTGFCSLSSIHPPTQPSDFFEGLFSFTQVKKL